MKKITALLLCFFLIALSCFTSAAMSLSNEADNDAVQIFAAVPNEHKITIEADGAAVTVNGQQGDVVLVERLGEAEIKLVPESGKQIAAVLLDDNDVTDLVVDGALKIDSVYSDLTITVLTEQAATSPTGEQPTEATEQPTGEQPTEATEQPTGEQPAESTSGSAAATQPAQGGSTEAASETQSGQSGATPDSSAGSGSDSSRVQTGAEGTFMYLLCVVCVACAAFVAVAQRKKLK